MTHAKNPCCFLDLDFFQEAPKESRDGHVMEMLSVS